MADRRGKCRKWQVSFSCVPKSLQMVFAAMKLKDTCSWKKSYDKPRQCIKKQGHYFSNKGMYKQNCDFSSSHISIWELDHKEVWTLKNWCFQTALLKKTLKSPLEYKEIKPVNLEWTQSWIFIGRTNDKADVPIFWPPYVKGQIIGKGSNARKDRRQENKGTIEGKMFGWHCWLSEHEFEQTPGDGETQGSLLCCSPWSNKELDMAEQLNNNIK